MRLKKITIALFIICALPLVGLAQGSGFDILITGPNSQALGMNGTVTAIRIGASNMYTNPANLAMEASSSFSADYSLWVGGLQNSHFAANFKKGNSAIAIGLLNSQADDFELRNRPQPSQGTFSVSYLSLAGAYAYKIKNFAAGITAQYLREQYLINDASGYAFNAGLSSRWFDDMLTISTTIRNLGKLSKLNEQATDLPTEWRVGFSSRIYMFNASGNNDLPIGLLAAADYVYPLQKSVTSDFFNDPKPYTIFSIGLSFANTVTVYSGYRTENNARPISFGTSIAFQNIGISYAFVPFNTGFGNIHSIGVSYRF